MCDFNGEMTICEVRVWNPKLAIMAIDALDVRLWWIKYNRMLNSLFGLNLEVENEMLEWWLIKWSFWRSR